MKRILSLFLSASMTLSLACMPVLADDNAELADSNYELSDDNAELAESVEESDFVSDDAASSDDVTLLTSGWDIPENATAQGQITTGISSGDGYWAFCADGGELHIYGTGPYTIGYSDCNGWPWNGKVDGRDIKKVIFHEGITTIPWYFCAMKDGNGNHWMSEVEAISIPSTMQIIYVAAFINCSKLKTIENGFPEGLKRIERQAFMGTCLDATVGDALYFPSTITEIGDLAFSAASRGTSKPAGYKRVLFADNAKITKIGDKAFLYETCMETIVIPKSVTYIGTGAFNASKAVEVFNVYFEGVPATIGSNAFDGRGTALNLFVCDGSLSKIGSTDCIKLNSPNGIAGVEYDDAIAVMYSLPKLEGSDILADATVSVSARMENSTNKLPENFANGDSVEGITASVVDNCVIKISNIPVLENGQKLVVDLSGITYADGTKLENKNIVIYKSGIDNGFLKAEIYDMNGEKISLTGTELESGVKRIELMTADESNVSATLCSENGDEISNASFNDGMYTFVLNNALEINTKYILKRNGENYITFTTDSGKMGISKIDEDGSNIEFKYYNTYDKDKKIYIMRSSGTLCEEIEVAAGTSSTPYYSTKNADAKVFVTSDFNDLKLMASAANADDITKVDTDSVSVSVTPFNADREAEFSGLLGDGTHQFAFIVFDTAENRTASNVIYADIVTTNADGSFSLPVTFGEDIPTGVYSVCMADTEGIFYQDDKIAYAKKEDADTAFELINEAAKGENASDEVYSVIKNETNAVGLGFVYDFYDKVYADDAEKRAEYEKETARIVANQLKTIQQSGKVGFTYEKKDEAVRIFRNAAIASAFYFGKIDNIDEVYTDISAITSEPAATWYNGKEGVASEKTASWKVDMTKRLTGVKYANVDDFTRKVTASMLLAIADNPAGTASLAEAITDFEAEIQRDVSDFNASEEATDKACIAISESNKVYNGFSFTELVRDIRKNNEANRFDNPTSISGSGGGSISGKYNPGMLQNPEPQIKHCFSDIESCGWAVEAIEYLYNKNIISGKETGKYFPEDNVLREEFVKMIVTAAEISNGERKMNFSDVKGTDWFYSYVNKAYSSGIINGIDENSFGAGITITRQDICVIIANLLKTKGKEITPPEIDFVDNADIADYAKESVAVLAEFGIINGYEDKSFRPNGFATRAEVAKIVYALLQII